MTVQRYKCKVCGYVYSPVRGEPRQGIKPGTKFEDLPDTYVCLLCGEQGKGHIGKEAFVPWTPQAYICDTCGYIYEVKRGEPRQRIKPGTPFDSLPDTYVCPVCGDPRVRGYVGKIGKDSFKPLML